MGGDVGSGRDAIVLGRHKDNRLSIRRPDRAERVAAKAGHRRRPRTAEEAAGLAIAGHVNDPQVALRLLNPVVEVLNRKRVVDPHLRFRVLSFLHRFAVRLFVGRARPHHRLEEDLLAVRTPARHARRRCRGCDPLRFTAAHDVEHINLIHLVVVTLGRKRDACAVGAPSGPALRSFARGQAARCRAAVARHHPEIGDLLQWIVRGLGHAEDDPLAIGRRDGRTDALKRPEQLMRERGRRLAGLRAGRHGHQQAYEPQRGDSVEPHRADLR